jgi:hypothetical protein
MVKRQHTKENEEIRVTNNPQCADGVQFKMSEKAKILKLQNLSQVNSP